ncbi:MAG: helix-turn-helix domain-containing protein, partial [Bacteroidota bacterium]
IGVDDAYALGEKKLLSDSTVGLLTVPFPAGEIIFPYGNTSFASNGYYYSASAFLLPEIRLSPMLTELKGDYAAFGFFISPIELFEFTGLGFPDIKGSNKLASALKQMAVEVQSGSILNQVDFTLLLHQHLDLPQQRENCYRVITDFIQEVEACRASKLVEVSKRIAFSGKHLRSTFKDVFGISPKKYLQLIQMQRVLSDMVCGEKFSLTDIAYRNGFYDQSHFNRVFKRFAGLCPRTFRKGYQHYAAIFKNTLVL